MVVMIGANMKHAIMAVASFFGIFIHGIIDTQAYF